MAHLSFYDFDAANVHGPRIRVKRLGRGPNERLASPHGHRFLEFIYFEEGTGHHRVGQSSWETASGDVAFVAPGEVHTWDPAVQEHGGSAWVVQFTADAVGGHEEGWACVFAFATGPLLRPFARSATETSPRARVPEAERPAWEAGVRSLHDELATDAVGANEAARAHLELLLVRAARLLDVGGAAPTVRPLVARVFEAIDAEYQRPISLADIAAIVDRSPSHLTSSIKRLTGRTVLEWITERRLAEARRRLVETEQTVAVVGRAVSYLDADYFTRLFRRAHGVTPAAWRQAQRAGTD